MKDILPIKDVFNMCLAELKIQQIDDFLELVIRDGKIVCKNFKFGCKIKEIFIPHGVQVLKDGCFSGTDLTKVRIPSSVTEIGFGCFANCNELKTIRISEAQTGFIEALVYCNNAEVQVRKKKV